GPAGDPEEAGPDEKAADQSGADGQSSADGDPRPALWLLPARGGEARQVFAPPGGVQAVATARAADTALLTVAALPGTSSVQQDGQRRAARRAAGVTAILHESGAVQYWDHDLGPD